MRAVMYCAAAVVLDMVMWKKDAAVKKAESGRRGLHYLQWVVSGVQKRRDVIATVEGVKIDACSQLFFLDNFVNAICK